MYIHIQIKAKHILVKRPMLCVGKLAIIGSDNGLSLHGAKPLSEPIHGYC